MYSKSNNIVFIAFLWCANFQTQLEIYNKNEGEFYHGNENAKQPVDRTNRTGKRR